MRILLVLVVGVAALSVREGVESAVVGVFLTKLGMHRPIQNFAIIATVTEMRNRIINFTHHEAEVFEELR